MVISFVCPVPVRQEHGGFVLREWLAAKGPITYRETIVQGRPIYPNNQVSSSQA